MTGLRHPIINFWCDNKKPPFCVSYAKFFLPISILTYNKNDKKFLQKKNDKKRKYWIKTKTAVERTKDTPDI